MKARFAAWAGLMTLVASSWASGQAVQETRVTTTGPGGVTVETRRLTQVIGSNVVLQGDTRYGTIEDFVLNDDGCIEFVVVSYEGKRALMPWAVAKVNYGQKTVTFDVAPKVVQPLFFAPNAWPNTTDPQFGTRMRDVFGPRALRREIRKMEREGLVPVPVPPPVVRPPGR